MTNSAHFSRFCWSVVAAAWGCACSGQLGAGGSGVGSDGPGEGAASSASGPGSGSFAGAGSDGTATGSVTGGSPTGDGTGGESALGGDGSGSVGGGSALEPVDCGDGDLSLGSAPVRRLSSKEYLLTLQDLFPSIRPDLPELPIEDPVDSFDNDARALGPSDVHVARWEEIAFRYTRELTNLPDELGSVLPCADGVDDAGSARECGEEWIQSFGLRAHRRPLSDEEAERYQALFDAQLDAIDFEAAVQLTTMAMLQSPKFLYRIESNGEGSAGAAPLDSWDMASRLSYFLWQRMPDAELFDAARDGTLIDPDGIETQARRMLADTRARQALADFHRQWLFFDRILRDEHDSRLPELFPDWTSATQLASHEELSRFVTHAVFEGGGTLSDVLLSRDTEVNSLLADIYGVEGPDDASTWESVTLPEDERAGILTRVGFLAAHAHSANGSPPLRGVYVMSRLFCLPPVPPPPDANTAPPETEGTAQTNRELFEERTAPSDCQGCHTVIDAFGFPFEHYDAVGAYRDEDNGQPVDAAVTLVGTDLTGEVDGAIELSEQLAQSDQVAACAVSRWYRYALGRGAEPVDQCALDRLSLAFDESGGDIQQLLVDIVTSPEFRHRPVEPQ